MISWLEQVAGELHATFRVRPAAMCARAGCKACGAWLRCQRAVARPGRTTSRRVELPNSDPAPQVWRAPEGPEGTGGLRGAAPNEVRTPSLAGGRALRRPEHPWSHKQPGPVTAGGPPPTGTHSGRAPQSITTERPEHQRRHEQHNNQAPHQRARTYKKTTSAIGCQPVVELGGFEPPTFSLRTRRATNCAIAPRTRTA